MERVSLPINTILQGNTYRYHIEKVLGQGSFGITYLARIELAGSLGNLQTDVTVAVKEFFMRDINERSGTNVMIGSNSDLFYNYRKDFMREARNLSKLKHPHIVQVLESFEENNTAYFSMEYIEGGNLNEYIESNGCLSERESLKCISQIIEALSCMHNNWMLHLDLKPLNIMRRNNGDLVLIDFGLSKQFNSDGEPESSTRIGGGTLGYAPLEQSNYRKENGFSPTLDIYALGGTLYKMLTGKTPPDASSVFNDGFPEDEMRNKGICQDIISLLLWVMEPMKRKRLQTMEDFFNEVQRILPHASNEKSIGISISSKSCAEPTLVTHEVCNGFHIRWNKEVSEIQKDGIRSMLKAMRKIGETKLYVTSEYGLEPVSTVPVMSLRCFSWHYIENIMRDRDLSETLCLPHTIRTALHVISLLSYWTGLPFRLSNEDEIIYGKNYEELLSDSSICKGITLCYSKDEKLQYKVYGGKGSLNDVNLFRDRGDETYDIQLVCDGLKPLYNRTGFEVPCTQEVVDEILPIGFGLYKIRKGRCWNIKSPSSPMLSYLPVYYEWISKIGICHKPRGGPRNGYDYLGIVAQRNNP